MLKDILEFLKGFVPGYAAIENLVAPVFGSDVDDYGQCRARCSDNPEFFPAAMMVCNDCVNKIASDAIRKLIPELVGASVFAAGVAFELSTTVLRNIVIALLEARGLTFLATKAIPFLGVLFIIGDIANLIVILISLNRIFNAANAAKAKFCVCP